MANIATITNNVISALSGTTSQVLLGDATLTDFKLDSLTDVNVPTPGDGDVLRWNATTSLWEASDAAGITGSASAGQVAYFTSANVQAGSNNLFWDNTNGRLGVGTNSPITKLDVFGTGLQLGTTSYYYNTRITNNNNSGLLFGGHNSSSIGLLAGINEIAFVTYGVGGWSEKVRLSGEGSLGIGTTTPNYLLDLQTTGTFLTHNLKVNATAAAGNYAEIAFQLWSGATGGQNVFGGAGTSRPSVVLRALSEDSSANGALVFATFGAGATNATLTEKMRLTSAGNLGIGTTAPAQKLHVVGSTILMGNLSVNTTYNGFAANIQGTTYVITGHVWVNDGYGFANASSPNTGMFPDSTHNITFKNNNATSVYINSSSNMGIGTTVQTYKLSVNTGISSSQTYGISIQHATNGINKDGAAFGIAVQNSGAATNAADLIFATATAGALAERMRITSSGNVGIGLTAPATSLVVRGNTSGYNKDIILWERATDGAVQGALGFGKPVTAGDENNIFVGSTTNHPLLLITNNTEKLRVTTAGFVGIGTAAPQQRLSVVGSGIFGADKPSGTQYLTVSLAGGVSDTREIGYVYNAAATREVGAKISFVGSGNVGGNQGAYLTFSTSAAGEATLNERMRLDASGNLGIGTSNVNGYWPSNLTTNNAKLGVYYDDSSTNLNNANAGLVILNSNTTAGTSSKLVFGAYNVDPVPVALAYISATNDLRSSGYMRASLIFATESANGNATGPTEKMRITPDGNLGIGTTAPTQKLHILGNSLIVGGDTWTTGTVATQFFGDIYGSIKYDYNTTNFTISSYGLFSIATNGTAPTTKFSVFANGNVGIGTSSTVRKLHINEASANTVGIAITNSSTTANGLQLLVDGAGGAALWNYSNTELTFGTNNNERIRITNTGSVGIGNTAPSARLHITSTSSGDGIRVTNSATATIRIYNNSQTTGPFELGQGFASGTDNVAYVWNGSNAAMVFGTNATERMRLDASGNLGLNVTPFAWAAGTRAFDFGSGSALWNPGSVTNTYLTTNAYFDITDNRWEYKGTGGASNYHQFGNEHRWNIAAAGTANAAITFTQAMTLFSTGNLAVGGTSDNAQRLQVYGGYITASDGTRTLFMGPDGTGALIGTSTNHYLRFITNNTERMRLDASGNLGIGTTSPTQKLDVNGDALINGVRVGRGPNSLSGNIVIGTSALNGVTTGGNNTAIGALALRNTTTGTYNIAIGPSAGGIGVNENTTGSLNIFIGAECQGESATDSNRTWIGSPSTTSTWLAGNLLLGTKSNSTYRLDVVGTGRISNGLLVSGGIVSIQTLAGAGTAIVVTDNAGNLSTQPTSTYLSSLSGEATNSGNVVTLTNSAVIGKVLTGLNVSSAVITSSDSILSAFGKIQGQIDALQGGTVYKGSWNASTNTPTITSSVGTQGNYYVVTTAGTTNINGVSSWAVGDWIIFNGSVWEKIPNSNDITSVNGQTGVVVLTTSNINEGTNLYYTDARARAAISLTVSGASGSATYSNSTGVLNIPTYTLTGLGGVASTRSLTINGVALDLSSDRSWSVGTITSIVAGSYLTGGTITSSGTIAVDATTTNTGSKIVARDSSGNFAAGTITAALSGNATTATTWQTARTLTIGSTGKSVDGSGNVSWSLAEIGAQGTITLTTSGTSGAATLSSNVLNIPNYSLVVNYNNDSNASYQMIWGSGNAIYGTAGITCNPFTDSMNLAGTLFAGGITVNGFGRMYGGDFWHSGTANNGTRTPTLKLGRFSDSETPAYVIYTDDTNGDILEFYSDRYTGDFRLTRNSETGLRNMMRVNSDNGGTSLDLYTGGGSTLGVKLQSNGDARFAFDVVAYYSFSDARLKTNVATIQNPLQKVMAMRGVTYEWNEGYKKGKKEMGLIAQEVMEIIPEVVAEKERVDGSKFLSVDYEHLTGLLIEAVKELKKEVDELKSK